MPRSSDAAGLVAQARLVPTPVGDARVIVSPARQARGVFVVGHGAGGGVDARDLVALRRALPEHGIEVLAVEQPWKVAGRRIAPAPRQLDLAWLAVLDALRIDRPLAVGGRSAGARVACRTAAAVGAVGVVALAFPLHPPGRPERSRLDELLGAGVPTLVVQGERDSFGGPEEFPAGASTGGEPVTLCPVPAAGHSFTVPASAPVTQQQALAVLVDAVAGWLGNRLRLAGC
jgi:uncharacterized protein